MTDRQLLAFEHGQRQHAGHAVQPPIGLRLEEDFAIGERDRFADPDVRRRVLPLDPPLDPFSRDPRRHFARRVTADAVHHEKDAGLDVDVVDVLVVVANASAIGGRRGAPAAVPSQQPGGFILHGG